MTWPNRDRWMALWPTARAAQTAAGWYDRLATAYAETQRHYHNQQHLAECLAEFDQSRNLARQPIAVEFALWFHDAVYDPKAGDNEEQSAALARGCLAEAGSADSLIQTVTNLVMATKNHAVDAGPDAGIMVDVDLSILGRDERRFFEYEAQIRQEYAWVPAAVFASKRAEILRGFLARKKIFATEWFHHKYEQPARRNLAESIGRLKRALP